MEEIWKIYKERYNPRWGHKVYEVSNLGNVKINGELVVFDDSTTGYYRVAVGRVHRMVAELFVPNPDNKPCVDHIDTNLHNNRFDNLRWVTHKENNINPLTRKHMSEVRKEIWSNPEHRQKQSESQKAIWDNPENRQKYIDAQNRPETKKKRSESLKGKNKGKHRVYNDPNDHTAGHHYE